jgi:hypothetical protein
MLLYIMQNLTKLSPARLACLTMIFFCANYGSMYAQGERKAFEEGDKILTFGLSGAGGGVRGFNSALRPTITFDYGLKGTNGIVSIGGFASYFASNSIYNPYGTYGSGIPGDSIYGLPKGDGNRAVYQRLSFGMRFALHYSTRKWDLYGGVMVGYEHTATKSNDYSIALYKILPNSTSIPFGTEEVKGVKYNSGQFLFSPYVGARYYLTKKVSLNVEVGQHTGHVGIGFKF